MNTASALSIFFPGKLVFGAGSLSSLPEEIFALNTSSVLLVTVTPLLARLEGLVTGLKQAGIAVTIDTGIVQEPTFADVENLLQKAAKASPDLILGIGGGSVLDAAKLIAALLGHTQRLRDITGIGLLTARPKKLICMPATSGTGSEVSPNAILLDEKDNQKKGIISPFLVPDIVYVDPLLTISVPPAVTAATGLDALTHCLEAYTNKFALPFIDMFALEGIRLIAASLVQAVKNGRDEEARTQVAMGSLLGGFCLGPVNTAGVHALSYPLGSTYHLAHGLSNALLLPYVMEFNIPAAPQRYAAVAVALGCSPGATDLETAMRGVEKIRSLIHECEIPAGLGAAGISRNVIPDMAASAILITRLLKNNPRPITVEDAIGIYTAAY